MSGHDNEELIDYEDEHDVVTNAAVAPSASTGAAAAAPAADSEGDKKNFAGIHSTGFRYFIRGICLRFARDSLRIFFQGFLVEARIATCHQ